MPVPQRFARGDVMGRGPYEKSGMLEDTALPPGKKIHERFEIYFPAEDIQEGKGLVPESIEKEMDVNVKLWYLPYGKKGTGVVWRDYNTTVNIEKSLKN